MIELTAYGLASDFVTDYQTKGKFKSFAGIHFIIDNDRELFRWMIVFIHKIIRLRFLNWVKSQHLVFTLQLRRIAPFRIRSEINRPLSLQP